MVYRPARPSKKKASPAKKRGKAHPGEDSLHPRQAEQLLIATIADLHGSRVLCTSLGRAQFAVEYARAKPDATVLCNFLDLYLRDRARESHADLPDNLQLECLADFPEGEEADLIALPFTKSGDSELARDLLQSGFIALKIGGQMVVSCDNDNDTWFHERMQDLFPKVTRRVERKKGVIYLATKTNALKKVKNFECPFAFRDEERLIHVVSRPGVFSHRRVDQGARALISAMAIGENERVLDIGCGSGVVTLAAALRAPGVFVQAVDSNPRAVECTRKGAELNHLSNVAVTLDAGSTHHEPGTFDVVLANPPYYSSYQIAEVFLQRGLSALKPDGRMLIVARQIGWYSDRMPQFFEEFSVAELKNYFIATGQGLKLHPDPKRFPR